MTMRGAKLAGRMRGAKLATAAWMCVHVSCTGPSELEPLDVRSGVSFCELDPPGCFDDQMILGAPLRTTRIVGTRQLEISGPPRELGPGVFEVDAVLRVAGPTRVGSWGIFDDELALADPFLQYLGADGRWRGWGPPIYRHGPPSPYERVTLAAGEHHFTIEFEAELFWETPSMCMFPGPPPERRGADIVRLVTVDGIVSQPFRLQPGTQIMLWED